MRNSVASDSADKPRTRAEGLHLLRLWQLQDDAKLTAAQRVAIAMDLLQLAPAGTTASGDEDVATVAAMRARLRLGEARK